MKFKVQEDNKQAIETLRKFVERRLFPEQDKFYRDLYNRMIHQLICLNDINVDLLIFIRDEVFQHLDAIFFFYAYAHLVLKHIKTNIKQNSDGHASEAECIVIKNILDLLRVIDFDAVEDLIQELNEEEDINDLETLSRYAYCGHALKEDLAPSDSDEQESEEESDVESDDGVFVSNPKKHSSSQSLPKAKKPRKEPNGLRDVVSFQKVFSYVWLALIAVVPKTRLLRKNSIDKLVLQHLSEHVMPHLRRPILLADYLTSNYQCGGVTAVLALESLFLLISKYNLDYPSYFQSLLRLCTVSVMASKYKHKLLQLLTVSLTSGNISAEMAGQFIQRFVWLALNGTSMTIASYCLTQTAWLLRNHPHCMTLLHDEAISSAAQEEKKTETDHSLHGLELLRAHYLPVIQLLVDTMEKNHDTTKLNTPVSLTPLWNPQTHTNDTYQNLILQYLEHTSTGYTKEEKTEEAVTPIKNYSLNYRLHDVLFEKDSAVATTFKLS